MKTDKGFHIRKGWTFRREPDGSVRVHWGKRDKDKVGITLTPNEWVSVMAHMSGRGGMADPTPEPEPVLWSVLTPEEKSRFLRTRAIESTLATLEPVGEVSAEALAENQRLRKYYPVSGVSKLSLPLRPPGTYRDPVLLYAKPPPPTLHERDEDGNWICCCGDHLECGGMERDHRVVDRTIQWVIDHWAGAVTQLVNYDAILGEPTQDGAESDETS